jgi:DNA-binding CsgD family transcriptional regulator
VPHDQLDWQIYDPEAMLPIGGLSNTFTPFEERLAHCEIEQAIGDVNSFRDLARRTNPVATLAQGTAGRPTSSRRYRELLKPNGISHEVRVALVHRGACWGTLVALRTNGPDFTATEQRWLAAASRTVAAGLARGMRDRDRASTAPGPGVLVIAPAARPVALNPAADHWLEILSQPPWGSDRAETAVRAVAVRATGQGPGAQVQCRLPTSAGWAIVSGSAAGPSSTATIVIDLARGSQILPVLSRAYGLTTAEQAVVSLVLLGWSSKEIGTRLHITTDTVGDHLKAVFRKTERPTAAGVCATDSPWTHGPLPPPSSEDADATRPTYPPSRPACPIPAPGDRSDKQPAAPRMANRAKQAAIRG